MSDATRTTARSSDRIDVHAHAVPGFYRDALAEAGKSVPDGIKALPDWDEASALRLMDGLGVRTAILSISSPGVHFGDDARSRDLCRRVNDYGAELKTKYLGRFGHLASVPLPDVEGAVVEASHALDAFGAEGVVVQSNHHGVYLGDGSLEPFWAALDQRSAVVLVHPTAPQAVNSVRIDKTIPQPAMEFLFDTSRSLVDLMTAGVLKRHENMRVIVPHAGAVLPILIPRIDLALPFLAAQREESPPLLRDAMRKLHFDLAGSPVPELLGALLNLVETTHLHYGSDFPFTPPPLCEKLLEALETTPLVDDKARRGLFGGNAGQLFPKLA